MKEKNSLELNSEKEQLEEFFNNPYLFDFRNIDEIADIIEEYIDAHDNDINSSYRLILRDSELLDDNTLYKLFENRIDIRKLMSDENFTSEFRYSQNLADKRLLIYNTLDTVLKDVKISDDEYTILCDNILYRLKQHTETYFAQLKVQVEKLPTEEVFSFLIENDKDYLPYMKSYGVNTTDRNLFAYTLCKYYPSDIRTLFSRHIQYIYCLQERLRIKELELSISYFIPLDLETKMQVLLEDYYASKVMKMYQDNISFEEIQKVLTKEMIESSTIPATIKRYDRSTSDEKVFIERPTLLPMKVINKIVKDADVKISNVESYSVVS